MGQPTTRSTFVDALLQLGSRMDDVLLRERQAVARIDGAALAAIVAEKNALAEQVRDTLQSFAAEHAGPNAGTDPEYEEKRRAVRNAAVRILASAEANRLLLADAVSAVAEMRGMTRPTGTYDARARLGSYEPGRTVKEI